MRPYAALVIHAACAACLASAAFALAANRPDARAAAQAADAAVARAPRGAVGSIEVVHDAIELRAKATRDLASPVLVRVTPLGEGRHRIDFIGSVEGAFDLLPYLEQVDGRPVSSVVVAGEARTALAAEIFTQLPPGHGTDVFAAPTSGIGLREHYTTLLWLAGAAWVAVPAVVVVRRRLSRPAPAPQAPVSAEPTIVERLFAAVDEARARDLDARERGALELRLLRVLRAGDARSLAEAVRTLRGDERTASVVRAVEAWLHAPDGGERERALAEIDRLRDGLALRAARDGGAA
jgi:hypothetical protein